MPTLEREVTNLMRMFNIKYQGTIPEEIPVWVELKDDETTVGVMDVRARLELELGGADLMELVLSNTAVVLVLTIGVGVAGFWDVGFPNRRFARCGVLCPSNSLCHCQLV